MFPGGVDGHLSPYWVSTLAKRALGRDWSIHTLRHAFASAAWDESKDLATVEDLLGHASPATTRVYVATSDKARRAVVDALWAA